MPANNTTRFSDRVEDYVKYRPHYPAAIIPFLQSTWSLTPAWVIADIGSGTGISTEPFLKNGNWIYAVEPNEPMRSKAEKLLAEYPRFVSIDGKAEATGLHDSSVDMVIAAQAFHWFDPVDSRAEFVRILCPGGLVALVWNERLIGSPFEKEYEDLILRYPGDYKEINHKNVDDGRVAGFFHPATCRLDIFPNEQLFDLAGLKGRLRSSSYIPKDGVAADQLMNDLEALFARYQSNGIVRVGYETKLYTGVLNP
jgi:SAM-dependent methyltransferase